MFTFVGALCGHLCDSTAFLFNFGRDPTFKPTLEIGRSHSRSISVFSFHKINVLCLFPVAREVNKHEIKSSNFFICKYIISSMDSSLAPSLSDFVEETYDDSDDAETMTAAQVLAKLEEVIV